MGNMIDHIRLRHRIFDVTQAQQPSEDWGHINYRERRIYVSPNLHDEYDEKTCLLHEIVHLLFDEMGRRDLKDDEPVVESLGMILYDFLRENPEFLRYIAGGKK